MANVTPFSFFCTICFEAFDKEVHYPVILPCGHTYLCNPCSQRLKRCMECRTSLFISVPADAGGSNGNGSRANNGAHANSDWRLPHVQPVYQRQSMSMRASSRFQARQQQHQQLASANKIKMQQIPLPLPKNFLLLSMMDASPRFVLRRCRKVVDADSDSLVDDSSFNAAVNDSSNDLSPEKKSSSGEADDYEEEYNSDEDMACVNAGVEVLNGSCGTYAVTVDEIEVLREPPFPNSDHHDVDFSPSPACSPMLLKPQPSPKRHQVGEKVHSITNDVFQQLTISLSHDSVVVSSNQLSQEHGTKISSDADVDEGPMIKPKKHPEDKVLGYSDQIQVVEMKNGYAKLARGYGYIRVQDSNIVKIGVPCDNACRLEAMLIFMNSEIHKIRGKRRKTRRMIQKLDDDLQRAMNDHVEFPEKASELEIKKIEGKNKKIFKGSPERRHSNEGYVSPASTPTYPASPNGNRTPPSSLTMENPKRRPSPSILRHLTPERPLATPDHDRHVVFTDNVTYTPSSEEGSVPLRGLTPGMNDDLSMPIVTRSYASPAVAANPEEFADNLANLSPFLCADMFGLASDNDESAHDNTQQLMNQNLLFSEVYTQDNTPNLDPRSGVAVDFRTGMSGHKSLSRSHSKNNRSQTAQTYRSKNKFSMSTHGGLSVSRRSGKSRSGSEDIPNIENTKTW